MGPAAVRFHPAAAQEAEDLKDRWYQRREMRETVGDGPHEEYAKRQGGDVVLELQATIHREEHLVLATHAV
jgi:hypothetical protein